MNLKIQNIQIDADDPFRNDLLNRKTEVENLSALICNVNSPAVLAIDSAWGTGKTTFIKMWENSLKKQDIKSLYFNAWATDFSDDPLVSFLGEMNDGLDDLIGLSANSKEAWAKTKTVGKQLAKRGLPALIKIATAGVIDAEKIIEDEVSKAMEALTGDALENYFKQKTAIKNFHVALKESIAQSPGGKPVVIFVDELDRCRPTYAISLLERIKHLFDIEGLVFVLSLDKTQLGHSIGAVYGEGIDSVSYLRRFIDFEYQLRRPDVVPYIKSLFGALSLDKYLEPRLKYDELRYDKEHLEKVFIMLAHYQNLSLREIEQLLASINLALRTAKDNEYIDPALLSFLVVAKNKRPELYRRYVSPSESETEMIAYLYELIPKADRHENFECALVEGFLIAAKRDWRKENMSETLAHHNEISTDATAAHEVKRYSERVVSIATRPRGMRNGVDLAKLVERIEMLSQFQFEKDGS